MFQYNKIQSEMTIYLSFDYFQKKSPPPPHPKKKETETVIAKKYIITLKIKINEFFHKKKNN